MVQVPLFKPFLLVLLFDVQALFGGTPNARKESMIPRFALFLVLEAMRFLLFVFWEQDWCVSVAGVQAVPCASRTLVSMTTAAGPELYRLYLASSSYRHPGCTLPAD